LHDSEASPPPICHLAGSEEPLPEESLSEFEWRFAPNLEDLPQLFLDPFYRIEVAQDLEHCLMPISVDDFIQRLHSRHACYGLIRKMRGQMSMNEVMFASKTV
jgi:hypothetical protein